MTKAQSATDAAGEAPAPLAALHALWDRFEGFWRSAAAADNDSAVERFLKDHGGVLTDDLEREISRRFGRMAGPQ